MADAVMGLVPDLVVVLIALVILRSELRARSTRGRVTQIELQLRDFGARMERLEVRRGLGLE